MLEYLFAKNLCNSLCLQETWWNNQTCQKNATAVCPVCLGYLVHPSIGCFRFPKVSHFSDFHFAFGSTFDGSCIFLVRCKDLFWSLATNWAQLPPVAGCAQPTSRGWLKMWTSSEQFRTATQAFDNDICHCHSLSVHKTPEKEWRGDALPEKMRCVTLTEDRHEPVCGHRENFVFRDERDAMTFLKASRKWWALQLPSLGFNGKRELRPGS